MTYEQTGYPKLANLMAREKDVAIFRRFDYLNLLSLLQLQAELVDLEVKLHNTVRLDDEDTQTVDPRSPGHAKTPSGPSQYSKNFRVSRDDNSEQHQLLTQIRSKVREYNDLAIQISQLNHIGSPPGSQLEALKDWLRDQRLGHPFLEGQEITTWEDENGDERRYMCLQPAATENDILTRVMSGILLRSYHHFIGHWLKSGEPVDDVSGHTSYGRGSINKISNLITTILACIMPVLTIFVLNILSSTNFRILVTLVFTAIFATLIATLSGAKRVEIFAATATFAAVEVVFIGSANGS